MQRPEEKDIIEEIRNNSNYKAFEKLFKANQPVLVIFAHKFVGDWEVARDLVQEVFAHFWENRNKITIETSLRAYLYAAVKNQCSNYIKHKMVEQKYSNRFLLEFKELEHSHYLNSPTQHESLYEKELEEKIMKAISELPDQCRETFHLSRFHGMKSKNIAEKMNVSVRTVETQIYRALKALKGSLKDFLTFF